MPKSKKPVYSNPESYAALLALAYKPMTARELEMAEEARKFRKLAEIRSGYKGEWNTGARYFLPSLSEPMAWMVNGESL